MSTQRRVTAPPETKVEVVTDSLRSDSLGMPNRTCADPLGDYTAAAASPHKEFRWIPPHGSRAFAPGFLADLVLPGVPGVGFSFPL
jgi:hypothetical protein